MKGYDYIGSPYSHPNPLVREERYLRVSFYLQQCLVLEQWAYSPIVHCHEIAKVWDMPRDAAFWRKYNFTMLARSQGLKVLRIEGWDTSIGLREEMVEAERLELPIIYV